MRITRRDFIKYVSASAAALGLTELQIFKLTEALANPNQPKVILVQGANCTGCIMTLTQMHGPFVGDLLGPRTGVIDADATYTGIEDVIIDIVDLNYLATIMAPAGGLAIQQTTEGSKSYGLKSFLPGGANASNFVLVVEGALPDNEYAVIGDNAGSPLYAKQVVRDLANQVGCQAVIALGQCAAFGNWPAARNQKAVGTNYARTNAVPVSTALAGYTAAPIVNLGGCPTQPEVFLLTVADFLTSNLKFIDDGTNRPSPYYDRTLHWANGYPVNDAAFQGCPRMYDYVAGNYAKKRGDSGCLIMIGCKGPSTKTPCTVYQYLGKRSFCTKSSTPCQGCHEKGYPDKFSPYLEY